MGLAGFNLRRRLSAERAAEEAAPEGPAEQGAHQWQPDLIAEVDPAGDGDQPAPEGPAEQGAPRRRGRPPKAAA